MTLDSELLAQKIERLTDWLRQHQIQSVLLFNEDIELFSISFVASLVAGVEITIPANNRVAFIETLDLGEAHLSKSEAKVTCYLGDFSDTSAATVVLSSPALQRLLHLDPSEEKALYFTLPYDRLKVDENLPVTLFTSGSTGTPKAIKRTFKQLKDEVKALETEWRDRLSSALFLGSVSHHHLYGLLFKICWPWLTHRAIYTRNIAFEEMLHALLGQEPSAVSLSETEVKTVVFITSPAFLKRLYTEPTAINDQIKLISFSAGGMLELSDIKVAQRCLKTELIQIYGSTESGAIAYRLDCEACWQPFPLVTLSTQPPVEGSAEEIVNKSTDEDEPALLYVHSPYCASHCYENGWFNTNDSITFLENKQFLLHGRADRLVKIEEKRLSLIDLEHFTQKLPFVTDSFAFVQRKERDYIVLFVAVDHFETTQFNKEAEKQIKKEIRSHLLLKFEAILIPKRITFVAEIPYNSQGKVLQAELLQLLNKIE